MQKALDTVYLFSYLWRHIWEKCCPKKRIAAHLFRSGGFFTSLIDRGPDMNWLAVESTAHVRNIGLAMPEGKESGCSVLNARSGRIVFQTRTHKRGKPKLTPSRVATHGRKPSAIIRITELCMRMPYSPSAAYSLGQGQGRSYV